MPELPEVELLVRHLSAQVIGRKILRATVHKPRLVRPGTPKRLTSLLQGAYLVDIQRRAKSILFTLKSDQRGHGSEPLQILGHLGMTGRMFVQPSTDPLPPHTAVDWELDRGRFVFVDPRTFGRLTSDLDSIKDLGPEPLSGEFSIPYLQSVLESSKQPIKVRLMDQRVVAGLGNIYASESLFLAKISPSSLSCRLSSREVAHLHEAVIRTLSEAIAFGNSLSLDFAGQGSAEGLFYFGTATASSEAPEERFHVYDRAGQPCRVCHAAICRTIQAQRSTYYCPHCQARR